MALDLLLLFHVAVVEVVLVRVAGNLELDVEVDSDVEVELDVEVDSDVEVELDLEVELQP